MSRPETRATGAFVLHFPIEVKKVAKKRRQVYVTLVVNGEEVTVSVGGTVHVEQPIAMP